MPPDKVRDFAKMMRAINDNRPTFLREPPKPGESLKDEDWPDIRPALLGIGWSAEQVDALSALEAYCLYQVLIYDRHLDEMAKYFALPYPVAKPYLQRTDERIAKEVRKA